MLLALVERRERVVDEARIDGTRVAAPRGRGEQPAGAGAGAAQAAGAWRDQHHPRPRLPLHARAGASRRHRSHRRLASRSTTCPRRSRRSSGASASWSTCARCSQPPAGDARSGSAASARPGWRCSLLPTCSTRYADGVWFVDLAPISDPRLVANAVAAALGVKEEAGRPVIEALHAVRRGPGARCSSSTTASTWFEACAAAGRRHPARLTTGVTLLATSREPLGRGLSRKYPGGCPRSRCPIRRRRALRAPCRST